MARDPLPDPHLFRDLAVAVRRTHAGTEARMPGGASLLDSGGRVRVGVLVALADLVAGRLALEEALPDWVVTRDVALQRFEPAGGAELHAAATLLSRGRAGLVLEVRIAASARGAAREAPPADLVAAASLDFARVTPHADAPAIRPPPRGRWQRHGDADAALPEPLYDRLGIEPGDPGPGAVRLPKRRYLENSRRLVQGGAIAMLAEASAERAAGHASGGRACCHGMLLRFLAPAREGPLEARAQALGASGSGASWRVEVRDGAGAAVAVARCESAPA